MAVNYDAPMTWQKFKALEKDEQHDYLQHLIDTYGANAVSFAKMFHVNANTVRRYLTEKNLGITLSRGSRVDAVRWNEFLDIQEPKDTQAVDQPEAQAALPEMQVSSATIRFCGTINVDAIAAELKRIFDGTTQGEIEISCALIDGK